MTVIGGDVLGATILDVAKASGFSKTTVSRALLSPEKVNKETLEKILEAARVLNYTPNAIARAMITKKTENIGFIIYDKQSPVISNPFYGPILESITKATRDIGYSLFISTEHDIRLPSGDIMMRKQVDGVIIASQTDTNMIQNFRKRNIPVVLLNNCVDLDNLCCVVSDDYGGAFQAVEYLINRGHKRIGLLSGRFSPFIYSRRYNAYIDAMQKYSVSPDFRFVQTVEPTIKDSFDCTRSMLLVKDRPTAIFCTNDAIAVGAIKAILRSGLKVPQDVSVIGYDDSDFCLVSEPELTSVHTEKDKMGQLTVELLNMQINGQMPQEKIITVGSRLIVRQSTG